MSYQRKTAAASAQRKKSEEGDHVVMSVKDRRDTREDDETCTGAVSSIFRNWGPDELAVAFVYFVQGVLGLSTLAVSFYLKDELKLDPASVAALTGAVNLPWLIKPLYGFLSDTVPILGYKRKSYLVICGILGATSWLLASSSPSLMLLMTCLIFSSATVAMSDVVVDSIVVQLSRSEDPGAAGALQSLCWGSRAVGAIASSYFSGSLVEEYGPTTVFAITAALPLFTAVAGYLSSEEKEKIPSTELLLDSKRDATPPSYYARFVEQSKALYSAVRQPTIFLPTIFMFCWQATPSPTSAMFFYFTEELKFSPEFMGEVKFASSIASLAGVGFYNFYLKRTPLRKIYLWSSIIGTILGLSQLLLVTGVSEQMGISNKLFAVVDEVVLSVIGQVAFMPSLVLAAKVCPEGVEASLFAAMMSIFNSGYVSSTYLGAGLTKVLGVSSTEFSNLWMLVLICNLSSLLPLPLLGLVPKEKDLGHKTVDNPIHRNKD